MEVSGRIDSLSEELKASRTAMEENDKRTHELLEKILSKMDDMESALATKKRGLFK